ncbi:hypothetical protein D3C76_1270020 [compost metagenome]
MRKKTGYLLQFSNRLGHAIFVELGDSRAIPEWGIFTGQPRQSIDVLLGFSCREIIDGFQVVQGSNVVYLGVDVSASCKKPFLDVRKLLKFLFCLISIAK